MDRGQSRGVRDVTLTQGKLHRLVVHYVPFGESVRQTQDQAGNPFVGGPAAEIERQLIGLRSFFDPDLQEFFQQMRTLEEKSLEVVANDFATGHVRYGFDGAAGHRL